MAKSTPVDEKAKKRDDLSGVASGRKAVDTAATGDTPADAESATGRPASEVGAKLPISDKVASAHPARDARLASNAKDEEDRPDAPDDKLRELVANAQAKGLLVEAAEVRATGQSAATKLADEAGDKLLDVGPLAQALSTVDERVTTKPEDDKAKDQAKA